MAWRIVIADDSPSMRSALSMIFCAKDQWTCVDWRRMARKQLN